MRLLRTRYAVLVGLGCALAAITTACAAPEVVRTEAEAKKATQASSVIVEIKNAQGNSLGSCSGTLVGPKMVLTAGHCITGAQGWLVTGETGSSKASVASTPWKNFRSDLAHPEHSDVGLILLDDEIKLDSYPSIATEAAKDGARGTRFRREAATSKDVVPTSTFISSGADKGFKLNYLSEPTDREWLDTGGAVLDSSGDIIGVVSGKGKTSKLLHIARVDGYANWVKSGSACSSTVGTRSWGGSGGGGAGYGNTPMQGGGGWWGSNVWGSSSGGYGGPPGTGTTKDGGANVPGYDPNAPTGQPTPAPTTESAPASDNSCPGTPACTGSACGSPGTADGKCDGPSCGGCSGGACADTNVDYGDCASCSAPSSGPVVK